MASLKKPEACQCGCMKFRHEFRPEQWICDSCNTVCAERPQRDSTKCRKCGVLRGSTPFKKGGNICKKCQSKTHKEWRGDNIEILKEKHHDSYQRDKKKRIAAVRKSTQRSPEAFIRNLMHHITKQSNYKKRGDGGKPRLPKRNALFLPITIDFDYLWGLWESQNGLCALSHLPMVHVFNDLCSISVDRIDSDMGYVPGNVQLVCKWVNLAKQRHSNEEFRELLVILIPVAVMQKELRVALDGLRKGQSKDE